MKKQFNVRLEANTVLAIKVGAKERQCSEAEFIEQLVAGSSNGRTRGFGPCDAGSIPAPAATDKRAVFEALKAQLGGGRKAPEVDTAGITWSHEDPSSIASLRDTPCAPFDVNLEGEPHRVTQMGKKLGLFYLGGGEPVFNRHLQPGELETFWERRIQ